MVYEPLHHKYRPQRFRDLVGQEAIATTFSNAIAQRHIAPAYLLTGPRGTGKTSSARILAKSLNCQAQDGPTDDPCGVCEACKSITIGSAMDVIEIDAASNTGVENIRELIERAQFAPVQCRYKVYVIDECLTGDSLVRTQAGWVRIDDPSLVGQQVLSYNEANAIWEYRPVLRWLERGMKQTYVIKTASSELRCTGNHLIRTEQGWIAASQIQVGMGILSPARVDSFAGHPIRRDESHSSWSTQTLDPIDGMGSGAQPWNSDVDRRLWNGTACPGRTAVLGSGTECPGRMRFVPTPGLGDRCFHPVGMNRCSSRLISSRSTQTLAPIDGLVSIAEPWTTDFDRVQSIELAAVEPVYDLEVAEHHNFVANGLLVHNCHMLSSSAFNAMLKTLEEPPPRVVFVLATTDPQRVLPTIISRCQRFDYRRIPVDSMTAHLRYIATEESIDIEDPALTLVAQMAQGGLRDAESLLDQLSLLPQPIAIEAVWDLVGAVPERDLLGLLLAIEANDAEALIDRVRHLMNRGREPLVVLQNMAGFYRDLLIAKSAPQRQDLTAVTAATWQELCELAKTLELAVILRGQQQLRSAEVQLKNTTQPRLWLEVTLMGLLPAALAPIQVQAIAAPRSASPIAIAAPIAAAEPIPNASSAPMLPHMAAPTSIADVIAPIAAPIAAPQIPTPQPTSSASPASSELNIGDLDQTWQRVIANVETRSTQMLLRQQGSLVSLTNQSATIGIVTQWMSTIQQKLPLLETAFGQVLGRPIAVRLEPRSAIPAPAPANPGSPAAPVRVVPDPAPQTQTQPIAPPPPQPVPQPPPVPQPEPIPHQPSLEPTKPEQIAAAPVAATPAPPTFVALAPVVPAPTPIQAAPIQPAPIQPAPIQPAPEPPPTPLRPHSPTPQSPPPQSLLTTPPSPEPLADWDEDELSRATRSFANFFKGEIVQDPLTPDVVVESIESLPSSVAMIPAAIPIEAVVVMDEVDEADGPDKDDWDDDVPF